MREHDWIVASINNPNFTNQDFKDVLGMTEDNTQMLSLNDYKNSQFIRDTFKKEDGSFDDDKFNSFYASRLAEFSKFNESDPIIDNFEYSLFDTRQRTESKIKSNNFQIYRVTNPDRITIGIAGRNAIGERTMTPSELAQTQKIYDPSTETYTNETPNDLALFNNPGKWLTSLFDDPLVLAKWEEDGTHINSITGQEEEHHKGEYKLNEDGQYFYEKLNGRSLIGQEVLSAFDIFTVDGTGINKYDFLDSDGLDKSITGSIAKAALTVAPLFIPYVGQTYSYALVARELSKSFPMLYGMASSLFGVEQDSQVLNSIAAIGTKFSSGTSEYAKQHTFAFENFANLMADVATQWGQQKAIANAIGKLRNGDDILAKASEQAGQMYRMEASNIMNRVFAGEMTEAQAMRYLGLKGTSLTEGLKDLSGWAESPLGKAALKKFLPAAENIAKRQARLGADAALAYMAIVSNTDVYESLLEHGASKRDAALVAFGSTLGMFGVDRYLGLGEIFFDNLTSESERAIRATFKKEAESWSKALLEEGISNPSSKAAGTWISKGMQFGKNAVNKYIDGLKHHSLGFIGKAVGEGLEEVSEELVTDISKQLYEIAGQFTPNFFNRSSISDVGAWDNALERYAMNFLGGAAGGGIFYGVDIVQNGKFTIDHSKEDLIYLISNHRTPELLTELEKWHKKGKLGNTNLSAHKTEKDKDGKLVYLTAKEGDETQNDFVYNRVKESILQLENILNENGLNLSEDELFKQMVLNEDRFIALQNELQGASYSTGYQNDFRTLTRKFLEAQAALNMAQSTVDGTPSGTLLTDNQKRDSSIISNPTRVNNLNKLQEEYNKLEQERIDFLSGKKSLEYTDKMLFAIDPFLRSEFISMTFEEYLKNNKGKTIAELTPAEQTTYIQEYLDYKRSSQKLDLTQQYEIYKKIKEKVDPHIQPLADNAQYYAQVNEQLLNLFDKNGNYVTPIDWNQKLETESDEEFENRDVKLESESDEDFAIRHANRIEQIHQLNQQQITDLYNKFQNVITATGGYMDPHIKRVLSLLFTQRGRDIKDNIVNGITDNLVINIRNKGLQNHIIEIIKHSPENPKEASRKIKDLLDTEIKKEQVQANNNVHIFNSGIVQLFKAFDFSDYDVNNITGKDIANFFNELAIKIANDDPDIREKFERYDRENVYEQLRSSNNILQDLLNVDLENESLMELVFGSEDDALINADDTIDIAHIDPSMIRVMLAQINFSKPEENDENINFNVLSDSEVNQVVDNIVTNLNDDLQKLILDINDQINNNYQLKLFDLVQNSFGDSYVHDLVKSVSKEVLGNREDLEEILDRLFNQLENGESKNSFTINDQDMNILEQIAYVLKLTKSYLYAASTRPNYSRPIGHNTTLNDFAKRHQDLFPDYKPAPELQQDVAAMAINQIDELLDEIDESNPLSWVNLSQNNKINKRRKFEDAAKAFASARVGFFNVNRDKFVFDLNGNRVDLLDGYETIASGDDSIKIHEIENLYYKNLHALLKSGVSFKDILKQSQILQKITDLEKVVDQVTSQLDDKITYDKLTSFDKVVYFLTISGISANDFQYFNKTRIQENETEEKQIAPLTIQQYTTRVAMAKIHNPDIFNEAIEYIQEETNDKRPFLQNIIFVDGSAGVGKSQVIARNTAKYFEIVNPDKSIWLCAPYSTQTNNLKNIVGNGDSYVKEDLFTKILDPSTYSRIKNMDEKDNWIEVRPLGPVNVAQILNTDDLKFNDIDFPGLLIIDEGTHFSGIEHQVLDAWAKEKGITIIELGDTNQNGYQGFSLNINREKVFAIRTPKLSISLRDVNVQKQDNLALITNLLNALQGLDEKESDYKQNVQKIKDAMSRLSFKVYNQETINGDLIIDSITEDDAKKLYGEIAYVGNSTSETLTTLQSVVDSSKLHILSPGDIQGQEFDFIVIDKDWKLNGSDDIDILQFLQDLYTMISRGKVGSIIINNGLTNIIQNNTEQFNKAIAPNLKDAIQPFKESELKLIDKLNIVSPEEFENSITPVTEAEAAEEGTPKEESEDTSYVEVEDTEQEELTPEKDKKEILESIGGEKLDNFEEIIQTSELLNSDIPIRVYGSAHFSGLIEKENENGENQWINTRTSSISRDLEIFTEQNEIITDGSIKDDLVRKLLSLKSLILYKHSYADAPGFITKVISENDFNNIKYRIEVRKKSDTDNFIGYTGLDANKMTDADGYVYTLVAQLGNNVVTLGLLANPETYKNSKPTIEAQIRNTISKLDVSDKDYDVKKNALIARLNNLDGQINSYISTINQIKQIAQKSDDNIAQVDVTPQFSALTNIRKKTSSGNAVKPRQLEAFNEYDESFIKSHPYTVISKPYVYIGKGFKGISDSNRGKVVVFVSNDTLLNPDELVTEYLNSKQDTNKEINDPFHLVGTQPRVRMLILNPKGATFKQLTYSTKLSKLFSTEQIIDGQKVIKGMPFEEDYMGARMYTSLWNWRANLTRFMNEYQKFKNTKGYSDDDLERIALYADALYRKNKGESISGDEQILSQNVTAEQLKDLEDFNDSLANKVRQFRLGGSRTQSGAYIRNLTNISSDNIFYGGITPMGIYLTPKAAKQYMELTSNIFNSFLDKFISLKDINGKDWNLEKLITTSKNGGKNYQNSISNLIQEAFTAGSLSVFEDGIEYKIELPSKSSLKYVPLVLTKLYNIARLYQVTGDKNSLPSIMFGDKNDPNHLEINNFDSIVDSINPSFDLDTNETLMLDNLFALAFHGTTQDITKDVPKASDAYFKHGFFADAFGAEGVIESRSGSKMFKPLLTNPALFEVDCDIDMPIFDVTIANIKENIVTNPVQRQKQESEERQELLNNIDYLERLELVTLEELGDMSNLSIEQIKQNIATIVNKSIKSKKDSLFTDNGRLEEIINCPNTYNSEDMTIETIGQFVLKTTGREIVSNLSYSLENDKLMVTLTDSENLEIQKEYNGNIKVEVVIKKNANLDSNLDSAEQLNQVKQLVTDTYNNLSNSQMDDLEDLVGERFAYLVQNINSLSSIDDIESKLIEMEQDLSLNEGLFEMYMNLITRIQELKNPCR